MPNVGLVTGPATPSARHAPRTSVVLPAPSSPATSTTSPGDSVVASSAPAASVSAALEVWMQRTIASETVEKAPSPRTAAFGTVSGAYEPHRQAIGLGSERLAAESP